MNHPVTSSLTAGLAACLLLLAGSARGASADAASPQPVPVPVNANELFACSEASLLQDLGLLSVAASEVRLDRPVVVVRDDVRRVLWSRWTRPGEEEPTVSGEVTPAPFPTLLAGIDLAEPGCWVWLRDESILRVEPGGRTASGLMSDEVVALGLDLDATTLKLEQPFDAQEAPRSRWAPSDALMRFHTASSPVAAPEENAGALNPRSMMAGLLDVCPRWRPGVSIGIQGRTMAIFCPSDSAKADLAAVAARHGESEHNTVTRKGSYLTVEGPFVMFTRVIALADGLVFTNDDAVALDIKKGKGEAWWADDAPREGVVQRTEQGSLQLRREGDWNRAVIEVPQGLAAALKGFSSNPVVTFQAGQINSDEHQTREGGVVGGVIGGELRTRADGGRDPMVKKRSALPGWPEAARCDVVFLIDGEGVPQSIERWGGTCPAGYPDVALAPLMKWRFWPAKDAGGRPVAGRLTVGIELAP